MDDDRWIRPTDWLRAACDPDQVCKLYLQQNLGFWILNESRQTRQIHARRASEGDLVTASDDAFLYDATEFKDLSQSSAMIQAQDELDSGLFKHEYRIPPPRLLARSGPVHWLATRDFEHPDTSSPEPYQECQVHEESVRNRRQTSVDAEQRDGGGWD